MNKNNVSRLDIDAIPNHVRIESHNAEEYWICADLCDGENKIPWPIKIWKEGYTKNSGIYWTAAAHREIHVLNFSNWTSYVVRDKKNYICGAVH
jgi:hypothetical protein